jgi:Planctomycete cytochrome C
MSRDRKLLMLGLFLVALGVGLLSGCKDSGTGPGETPPSSGPVSFKNDVRPIFLQYGCDGCHGGTNNLWVTSVDSLKKGGIHGPAIVPGNSAASILVQKISPTPPFGSRMPFNGTPVSESAQSVIKKWIDQGAIDN